LARSDNTVGGGATTTRNGLAFERGTDLREAFLEHPRYKLVGDSVVDQATDLKVGTLFEKKLHIIEKKYQAGAGFVDEKLQTCHFKLRQYTRLLTPLGIQVQFHYLLSDWFRAPSYRDMLEYIEEVGCDYFFHGIPLDKLGL